MLIKQVRHISWRSPIFLLLSILIIACGGLTTLLWQMNYSVNSGAAGRNVVGSPTLSGDFVDKIFAGIGSPMVGTGKVVEQTARQTNIDDAFAVAVWWVETNDGMAGVGRGDRNPGAVRGSTGYSSGYDGYTLYPSYSAAIVDWFHVLQSRYVSRGLTSVYSISGPYVGTSGSGTWAAKVTTLMLHYRNTAPPMQILHHQRMNDQPSSVVLQQAGQQPAPVAPQQVPLTSTQSLQPQQLQPAAQSPAFSPLPQFFLALSGLFAVIALIFIAWRLRRGVPLLPTIPAVVQVREAVASATSTISEPTAPLPALYANEFSPVLEHASAQLEAFPAGLFPASTEALERQTMQTTSPLVQPVTPLPAVPSVAPAASVGGGLLRRYRLVHSATTASSSEPSTGLPEQPTRTEQLLPVGTMPFRSQPVYRPRVDTDALPALPGRLLPSRTLEAVGVASGAGSSRSGGGLLQRYRAENGDRNEG